MGRIITDLSMRRARKRRIDHNDPGIVEQMVAAAFRNPSRMPRMVWPTPDNAALSAIIARAHAPAPRIET